MNGRVTYEIIKNVRFAYENRVFDPSVNVCFVLTGHGSMNAYLYECGLCDSTLCECGRANED